MQRVLTLQRSAGERDDDSSILLDAKMTKNNGADTTILHHCLLEQFLLRIGALVAVVESKEPGGCEFTSAHWE